MIAQNIEMLRVRIERTQALPLVLAVSAALSHDGKTLVAAELAQSMAAAGYRTLLVLADGVGKRADLLSRSTSAAKVGENGLTRYVVTDHSSGFDRLILRNTDPRLDVSRDDVKRLHDACRAAYGVTIIETATAVANPLSMLAASLSDGVLLAIREGRRVKAADRWMAELMTREALPFLGVVAVDGELLKNAETPAKPARTVDTLRGSVDLAGHEQQAV